MKLVKWIRELKERKKEDTWFWYMLGYGTALFIVIVETMIKNMRGAL